MISNIEIGLGKIKILKLGLGGVTVRVCVHEQLNYLKGDKKIVKSFHAAVVESATD